MVNYYKCIHQNTAGCVLNGPPGLFDSDMLLSSVLCPLGSIKCWHYSRRDTKCQFQVLSGVMVLVTVIGLS